MLHPLTWQENGFALSSSTEEVGLGGSVISGEEVRTGTTERVGFVCTSCVMACWFASESTTTFPGGKNCPLMVIGTPLLVIELMKVGMRLVGRMGCEVKTNVVINYYN